MSQPFQIPQAGRVQELWDTQKGLCRLCGKPMLSQRFQAPHATIWARQRATVDHIQPRSKGGTDTAANLQLVHARCNTLKGAKRVNTLSLRAYFDTGSGMD